MAKLIVLVLLVAAALAARVWIPTATAESLVRRAGYPMMAVIGAIFAFQSARFLIARWKVGELRLGKAGLFVCLSAAVWLQLHEPRRYKVLFDEFTTVGQAWNMHYHRSPFVPEVVHRADGVATVFHERIDKRPLAFAFLLSAVHDLTGYRISNVFYLNALIAGVLVFFAFIVGARYGAFPLGCGLVAAVAFNPLIAQNATGASGELFNLLLIAFWAAAAFHYLRDGGKSALSLLTATALVLAQARYESVLYIGTSVVVVLVRTWRTRTLDLTWFAAVAPVFMVVPLLTQKVFLSSPALMETTGDFFSFGYLPENALRAGAFLLSWQPQWANNVVFSVVGLLGCGLLGMLYARYARRTVCQRSDDAVFALLGLTIAGTTAAGWLTFWGHWNDPVAARFSLPFQLLCLVAVARVAQELRRGQPAPTGAVAAFVVAVVVAGLPVIVSTPTSSVMVTARVHEHIQQFLEGKPKDRTLVVYDSSAGLIAEGWAAIPTKLFNVRTWKTAECLRQKLYDEIIVIEPRETDLETGREQSYFQAAPLNPHYIVEPLAVRRVHPNYTINIGRVTGVREEAAVPPADFRAMKAPFPDEESFARRFRRSLP